MGDNVFTEGINKIASGSNDDKGIQSIDSIETYEHGMRNMLYGRKRNLNAFI